jgi:hypothetical protein
VRKGREGAEMSKKGMEKRGKFCGKRGKESGKRGERTVFLKKSTSYSHPLNRWFTLFYGDGWREYGEE